MSKPRGNGWRPDRWVNLLVYVTILLVVGAYCGPRLVAARPPGVPDEPAMIDAPAWPVVERVATVVSFALLVLSGGLYVLARTGMLFVWLECRIRVSRAAEDDERQRSVQQLTLLLLGVAALVALLGVCGVIETTGVFSAAAFLAAVVAIVASDGRWSGSRRFGICIPPNQAFSVSKPRDAVQKPTSPIFRPPVDPGRIDQPTDVAQMKEQIAVLADTRATYEQLKDTGNLPSRPTTVLQILQLCDPSPRVDNLVEIVKWDPAVTARVLQWANSVWSHPTAPITSLERAINRLGKHEVLRVALSVFKKSNRTGRCAGFDYATFWSESAHRAAIGEVVTRKGEEFTADEAFTAGLLCQIGRLSFASVQPGRYAEILTRVDDAGGQLLEEERSVFGIDHNELGAHMMRDWGMPEFFWQAIHFQDDRQFLVQRTPERALATTLAVAGHMWGWLYGGSAVDIPQLASAIKLAKELDVDRCSFEEQYDGMADHCEKVATLFEVRTPPFPPWPRDLP